MEEENEQRECQRERGNSGDNPNAYPGYDTISS